ncbi:hypothetical protein [Streptomyces sp. NPDC001843]|uniref:hypothetical protein n=1 Tax=Streptomyces sp. NPDC001843 TaxID=3364617 RepID=UPI003681DA9E
MAEPDWKADLQRTIDAWVVGGEIVKLGAYGALMPHIEAAYQRGLMAGRSQAGYATRRKSKELPCPPSPSATGASESIASAGDAP